MPTTPALPASYRRHAAHIPYHTALATLAQPASACGPHHSPVGPPICLPTHPRRFQTALGYPDAAKECLLKRVRALGGAGWAAGADGFETYAHASEALCEAYLQVKGVPFIVLLIFLRDAVLGRPVLELRALTLLGGRPAERALRGWLRSGP